MADEFAVLSDVGAGGFDIDRIQRLTRRHEQPVSLGASEADVGAGFRQTDHSNAIPARRDNLNAGTGASPDVAIGIATNPIGRGRCAGSGNIDLDETFAIANRLSIDVPDFDLAAAAGVGDVDLLIVRREADSVGPAVRSAKFIGKLLDLKCLAVDAIDAGRQFGIRFETFIISANTVIWIGEPDAPVRTHDDVIGRIQSLALKLFSDDGHRPIRLITHNPAPAVFARKLAALKIECVAVAVSGWISKYRHPAIVFDPSHLHIVRNVAPYQVAANAIPRRTLGPQRPKVMPPDNGVADDISPKPVVEGNDVGIRILNGILP